MKNFVSRHFAVAMAMLVCISMWGCSEDRFKWYDGRIGAEIVGFVNDSLVIVGDAQAWLKSHEGIFEPYSDVAGSGHERLCVYNYRVQEDGPRWCGQLDDENMTNAFRGQMTDSIVWGGDLPNSIRLWKIGESQHKIKLDKSLDGCSREFGVSSVKQWTDGKFIVRGDNSLKAGGGGCHYAILDTVSRTLIYKSLNENLGWIEDCNDVRAWGDDVYCVVLDDEGKKSCILKNEKDTISTPRNFAIGGFWGDMIKMSGNICSISDDIITCSDVVWYGNELKFYQNDEVIVNLE